MVIFIDGNEDATVSLEDIRGESCDSCILDNYDARPIPDTSMSNLLYARHESPPAEITAIHHEHKTDWPGIHIFIECMKSNRLKKSIVYIFC